MFKNKNFIFALSTLSGTIIGAGFFSLPYITARVGVWVMLAYIAGLSAVVILVHRLLGEVVSHTPGLHRLPGYAEIHLGKWGKTVEITSAVIGTLGALLAYLIIGGDFLWAAFSPLFGGAPPVYAIVYLAVGAALIFSGTKAIAKIELAGLIMLLGILGIIFVRGLPLINPANFMIASRQANFFLPYGPVLFSLWGAALIPELKEMLGEDSRLLKKIIAPGIIVPAAVYALFIFLVLGISGQNTTSEAVAGLKNFFGGGLTGLMLIFGAITTFTSFIAMGLTLKKSLWYDLKIPKNLAWLIVVAVLLILYLAGFQSFIGVIGLVGAVLLGIDGIVIILMHQKIVRSKIRYLYLSLILIFVFGIVYELAGFFPRG